jgi:hypothetical protein
MRGFKEHRRVMVQMLGSLLLSTQMHCFLELLRFIPGVHM